MIDRNKLLGYINKRLDELFGDWNAFQNEDYNSDIEELLVLKKMIKNGDFNINIW